MMVKCLDGDALINARRPSSTSGIILAPEKALNLIHSRQEKLLHTFKQT